MPPKPAADISDRLLAWYDAHARTLPWRAAPNSGAAPDPYRVWLSEIMLQQTTAAAVAPRFEAFLARFPSLSALAAAPVEDVLEEWAGLGYYARARNLHKCAQVVMADHGGAFPQTAEGLRALPGVGPYTAGAISAIAFDACEAAVDGNVERVVARLFAVEAPMPAAKPELRRLAEGLVPNKRAGDFAQAMMDLGATVCRPRTPDCLLCPISSRCEGRKRGLANELPRRAPKKAKPERFGVAFVLQRPDGAVLLRRRPDKGLLGGTLGAPSTPWEETPLEERAAADIARHAPAEARWRDVDGAATHVFTHFRLTLAVRRAEISASAAKSVDGEWTADALNARLPTVMRKVLRVALAD